MTCQLSVMVTLFKKMLITFTKMLMLFLMKCTDAVLGNEMLFIKIITLFNTEKL